MSSQPTVPAGYNSVGLPGFTGNFTVPNLDTFMNQANSYINSPFMTPAALANQAKVANAGLPQGEAPGFGDMSLQQQWLQQFASLYPTNMPQGQSMQQLMQQYAGPQNQQNASMNAWLGGGAGSLPYGAVPSAGMAGGAPSGTAGMAGGPGWVPPAAAPPPNTGANSGVTGTGSASGGDTYNPFADFGSTANTALLNFGSALGMGQQSQSSSGSAPLAELLGSVATNPYATNNNPTGFNGYSGSSTTPAGSSLFSQPTSDPTSGSPYAPTTPQNFPIGGAQTGSPDQILAYNAGGGFDPLNSMAQGTGAATPVSATLAWDAMVAAMDRQTQQGQTNLAEQFSNSGGRFSTAYGTASTDYQNQAALQKQALLGQLQMPALMQAQQIQAGAGTQLGQQAQQDLGQLSSQDWQSQMQQYMASQQAASSLFGAGANAAGTLNQTGSAGAMALLGGGIQGANNLFGSENTAGLTTSQQQLQQQQMVNQAAGQLSQLWQSNLGLGSQLGQTQYNIGQSQLNNLYQEYLRTQPQSNPLLPYMMSIAGNYPMLTQPQTTPSIFSQIFGPLMGAAGAGIGAYQASDERLKENIEAIQSPIGDSLGLQTYVYNFKGLLGKQIGFLAQEVEKKYPSAVLKGDESRPWMINYHMLTQGVH